MTANINNLSEQNKNDAQTNEHDVNILLKDDWDKLEKLLKKNNFYKKIFRFFVILSMITLIIITTNSLLLSSGVKVVFFESRVLLSSLVTSNLFLIYLFYQILESSEKKLAKLSLNINTILHNYSSRYQESYYINERNVKLLVEGQSINISFQQMFWLPILLILLFVFTSIIIPLQYQIDYIQKENQKLKEQIKLLEKK